MPFISYAQNYEDVMLWRTLRDVEKGFYVDVGAADPQEWSVTLAFYERGWSGINIEPLDEYFDKLRRARPRDTNLKIAIGKEAGIRTLHAFPHTGLSTIDPGTAAEHRRAGFAGEKVVVPVLPLTKILKDCGKRTIHFLKIDTEGAETEVLEGLDLARIRPWIIVVEATEPRATVSSRDKWEYLITGRRYGFAYFDGLNCFYVADEVSKLKERLAAPPNVFDNFVRSQEWHLGNYVASLEKPLEGEQPGAVNIRDLLAAEQARSIDQQNLWFERLDDLSLRMARIEAQLAFPWFDRAIGRVFEQLYQTGNRLIEGVRHVIGRVLNLLVPRNPAAATSDSAITDRQLPVTSQIPESELLESEFPLPSAEAEALPVGDPTELPASSAGSYVEMKTVASR